MYVNRFFVCENSPSLWPTISCVTVTGMYSLPLWTWNLILPTQWSQYDKLDRRIQSTHPMKLGRIVQSRACVFIGTLFWMASRRLGNATKNGPIHKLSEMTNKNRYQSIPFQADLPPRTTNDACISDSGTEPRNSRQVFV